MSDLFSGQTAEQMSMFDVERGDAMTEKAKDWIRHNHSTWLWMCKKAAQAASEKRRFSIARLVEEARYTKPVQGVDEYKINNDLRAPLARMLRDAVPQCREYIEIRSSKVDL